MITDRAIVKRIIRSRSLENAQKKPGTLSDPGFHKHDTWIANYLSNIATTLDQPALPPVSFTGKQDTLKP